MVLVCAFISLTLRTNQHHQKKLFYKEKLSSVSNDEGMVFSYEARVWLVAQIVDRHLEERTRIYRRTGTRSHVYLRTPPVCCSVCLVLGLDSVGEDKGRTKQANVSQA